MSIVMVGSTSGSITLQEPAIAGNTVLTLPASTGTILTTTSPKAGNVIQVVQATFTGTQTISPGGVNANWTDVTGLSLSITPSSSSSRILLLAQVTAVGNTDRIVYARFVGGNSGSYIGNAASSRARTGTFFTTPGSSSGGANICMNYLDSPSTTSSITYKVQLAPNFSTGDVAVNYNLLNDGDFAYIPRGSSSIIAMEIAG